MKRFLLKGLSFFLCVLGVSLFFNTLQTYFNNEPPHYKLQYEEARTNSTHADGIIIGSSHSTHSIRPSILDGAGVNFFNFSLNGSNPIFYFKWYNKIFKSEHPIPRYCILNIDWFMFNDEWTWRKYEQDSEHFPTSAFWESLFDKDLDKEILLYNRFAFLKYRKNIGNSLLLRKGDNHFVIKGYDRGFIPCWRPYDSVNYIHEIRAAIVEKQVKAFKNLIDELHSDKVHIIFVMTPEFGISKNEYDTMTSLKIIDALAAKYNIHVLNYNRAYRSSINDDIHNFIDWGHLNESGSIKFSKALSADVRKIVETELTQ